MRRLPRRNDMPWTQSDDVDECNFWRTLHRAMLNAFDEQMERAVRKWEDDVQIPAARVAEIKIKNALREFGAACGVKFHDVQDSAYDLVAEFVEQINDYVETHMEYER